MLQRIRRMQETPEFRKRSAKRSGVEGTLSQGTRAFDLCQSRYIGLGKDPFADDRDRHGD